LRVHPVIEGITVTLLPRAAVAAAAFLVSMASQAALVGRSVDFTSDQLTLKFDVVFDDANYSTNQTTGVSNLSLSAGFSAPLGYQYTSLGFLSVGANGTSEFDSNKKDFVLGFKVAASPFSYVGAASYLLLGDGTATVDAFTNVTARITSFDPAPTSPPPSVPEPGTLALVGLAGLMGAAIRRRT
jgi:hypothetical protein